MLNIFWVLECLPRIFWVDLVFFFFFFFFVCVCLYISNYCVVYSKGPDSAVANT